MDVNELIDNLRMPSWHDLEDPDATLLADASDALSTLQAENEKLKRALAEMKKKPWSWRRRSSGHGESVCRSICGAVRRRRTEWNG